MPLIYIFPFQSLIPSFLCQLLPYYLTITSYFSKPLTSYLRTLPHASYDLMNSQVSDTIYVQIVCKVLSLARAPSGSLDSSVQIFTSYQYKRVIVTLKTMYM